jgi:hypothetical protein
MAGENPSAGAHAAPETVVLERRAAVRQPCLLEITCRLALEHTGDPWVAPVRDLSEQGIGLVLPFGLEPGVRLVVEIPYPDEFQPRRLEACVAHSTERLEGGFAVGCTIAPPLKPAEVTALLEVNLLEV